MESNRELIIPGTNQVLRPGYRIKLGRFENSVWLVGFGWYSNCGNRPCCGWYLTSEYDKITKPLQLSDLDDVYLVDMCHVETDFGRPVESMDKEIIDARLGADGNAYPSLGESIRSQIISLAKNCTHLDILDSLKDAPLVGDSNTLYVDLEETMVYVWANDEYVCVSASGDQVESSDINGHITVNGEDVEVYCPEPIDSVVSCRSTNAVQSRAVHSYVKKEVVELKEDIVEIKNTLAHGIMYEIIE